MAKKKELGETTEQIEEIVVISSEFKVVDGVEGNEYIYSDGSTKFIPL